MADDSLTLLRGQRERLPSARKVIHLDLQVGQIPFTLGIGFYPDERVGEIWIEGAFREGGEFRTALNVWARTVSKALQFGMPLSEAIHTYEDVKGEIRGGDGVSIYDAVANALREYENTGVGGQENPFPLPEDSRAPSPGAILSGEPCCHTQPGPFNVD